ncbi:hypothetical protein [Thermoanaerobacter sp. RKWS2]|uniref:hypothetical protein n=1 Tax=Thermoanaerobacter sp. RKWS2 TaxID=2983842 RepID=UPI00224A86C8|nr:hypothetical protein [Thermoanaerobacter sp. RKWS2]UZQ81794.1 hypothetical protein OEI98_001532 [Thermoanaerobacter sp. RKWS2]
MSAVSDLVDISIKKLKFNETAARKEQNDFKKALERASYMHRIVFLNFTAEEMKEIASAFNSKFYVLPDDIREIDFSFENGYVFVYVKSNIPEEKIAIVKAVIHHYAALCETVLKDRKVFFIEAYEKSDDFSKYSSIKHHVDYKIRKEMNS